MNKTWILCGVAGSGKSSLGRRLAEKRGWKFLDADDFHPPANIEKMRSGGALDEADREPWLRALEEALRASLGQPKVLAFPGLKAVHRARLEKASGSADFAFLNVSLQTARARLQGRGGFFPVHLLESQFQALDTDLGAFELDAEASLDQLEAEAAAWVEPGQAAVIGLGRMGLGMAGRLSKAGFKVFGWDSEAPAKLQAKQWGIEAPDMLQAMVASMPSPRRILLSLPAGEATQGVLNQLAPALEQGDLIIDAANARFSDSKQRQLVLAKLGIGFVDAGVSGGIKGKVKGYCVMAGGAEADYRRAYPLMRALAAPGGLMRCGEAGAGHFVKMAHNGIEYGMMQAYAEGFELMAASKDYKLPLGKIAGLWGHGAVVRSWLLELLDEILADEKALEKFEGRVGENSSGAWAAEAASALGVEMPALAAALSARKRSREKPSFAGKILSALRHKFGGHGEASGPS